MRQVSSEPSVDYRKIQTVFMAKNPELLEEISNYPMTVIEALSYLAGQYAISDMEVVTYLLFNTYQF